MRERDRWNKGQTVYTRSDWPRRRLHVRFSTPMRASKKPCASEPWDSPTTRELVPWDAPGHVTWHALGGGDPGDPTALITGPDGAVVVADELTGPWGEVTYVDVPVPQPARAPHGGDRDWFICLWLPREGGQIEATFSVSMGLDEAVRECLRYQGLGYKGKVVRAQETVTYPG